MAYDVLTPTVARLWPYSPDWSRGFDVRRAFSTDIVVTRDRTEQRRALRDSPRIAAEYRTAVSGAERRAADHHLRAWQNKPVVVPDFARWARLGAASSAGASALNLIDLGGGPRALAGDMQSGTDRRILAGDMFVPGEFRTTHSWAAETIPAWIGAGQPIVLCGANGVKEQVVVESLFLNSAILEDPLVNSWAVGDVYRPTFFGLFEGRIASSRPNGDAALIDVVVNCYPGGEPPRAEGEAWATLLGTEIFTQRPDYAGPPSVGHLWPVEQVDVGRGRTAQFRPVERHAYEREAAFNGLGTAAAAELEQFFDRMKGRRGAFYVPSWDSDFALASTADAGTSAFTASGSDLADDFGSTDYGVVDEGVAVCLTNGTIIYRRITDISASGGNSLVTVNAPWGTELTTTNVARISRMPLCRFAADEMTMSWQTPLSAGTRLSFTQVPG